MKVKDLCQMALLLALLVVGTKISFNIGIIPITMQTFVVIMIGYILGAKKSSIVFTTYIGMGLLGLPVFSGGGGFAYVFKPSFGFIIGFWLSSIVMGISKNDNKFWLIAKGFLGLLVIYLAGTIYMYCILNMYMNLDKSFLYVLQAGVLPFIAKDSISVVLAYVVYLRIKNVIKADEPVNMLA